MTTPGDRKLFKATKFNIFDIPRFQKIFDEYSSLTNKFADTTGYVLGEDFSRRVSIIKFF